MVTYLEAAPGPALAPWVLLYWTLEGAGGGPEWIFPDGHMEMIWHFGDPFLRMSSTSIERQPRALLAGQIDRPLCVAPSGRAGVFGVRFRPFGARAFLRFPLHEVRGRVESLGSFDRAAAGLDEPIAEAAGFTHRVSIVERFLLSRLRPIAPLDETLSPRQYRRRFLDAAGIGPKTFARIQRFQQALRAIDRQDAAGAALDSGYFDQAHFIRDFRQFTGMTPGEYLRHKRGEPACPFFPIPGADPSSILRS